MKELLAKHDEFIPGKTLCVIGGIFHDLLLLRLLAVSFFFKLFNITILDSTSKSILKVKPFVRSPTKCYANYHHSVERRYWKI